VVVLDEEPADMTLTLSGRIQTRLALLAVVGVPWTMMIAPLLPGGVRYGHALASLPVIAVLGVGWELLYHGCQQLRWGRDWPSVFALAAGIPEGALAWPVLRTLGLAPRSPFGYALFFGTTWLLIWLVAQGPVRVIAPWWRHTGGRLIPRSAPMPEPVAAAPRAARITAHRPRSVVVGAWAMTGLVSLLALSASTTPAAPGGRRTTLDGASRTGPNQGAQHAADRVEPVSLAVPRIATSSTLMRLGLDSTGEPETPPVTGPVRAGWYALGPAPGQLGPAVIVGHVDGARPPGIFHRLRELAPGDEILIGRADSSVLRFVVTRVQQAPVVLFPSDEVYRPSSVRELRLITCGGGFDSTAMSYRQNVIVFAALDADPQPVR
jgi:hypothetical protein